MDDEATESGTSSTLVSSKTIFFFGDAHVIVECVWPFISKFLRVTVDSFLRAGIELCMHRLVQPQTHLPMHRSIFLCARLLGLCLKLWVNSAMDTVDFRTLH